MKQSTNSLGLALFLTLTSIVSAAVPKLINFQGILKDAPVILWPTVCIPSPLEFTTFHPAGWLFLLRLNQ